MDPHAGPRAGERGDPRLPEGRRLLSVSIDDIEAAARAIEGAVVATPTSVSQTLSEILGATIFLKFENLQFTASFKERGARNRLLALSADESANGVVAVSAGNHGQAVARHASLLGIPATIVMPATTPFVKVARTRHLGAKVELVGNDLEAAMVRGRELVSDGLTFIHPYDDPLVIAGQGTVALELFDEVPDLDHVLVPVGGGGLIAGIAVAAKARAIGTTVVGVETETYPGMANALGANVTAASGPTMAEGIAVNAPGALALEIVRKLGAEVLVVTERDIEDAVNMLLEIEKVVVEGAGAAGIAAISAHRDRFNGKRIGVILTGGNIDPRQLASLIERGLVRSGRLARLRVQLSDQPGALAALLSVVADAGANLLEVDHQRLFADVSLRSADVDLVVECEDAGHRDQVLEAISSSGYRARLLPLDVA